MTSLFSLVDDKHIPLYRVLWVADVPHFCGADDCTAEGRYEIRLDADESLFGTREERDGILSALEAWHRRASGDEDTWE